jgi:hypothetical protein
MNRRPFILLLLAAVALGPGAVARAAGGTTGVGLTGDVKDVLLPGPELRVKGDPEGRSPVVVRLTAVYPHGTAGFRYDFTWFAYEPGSHNLTEYLERVDGSPPENLPPVTVEAVSLLPPGPPRPLAEFSAPVPNLGGYRTTLIVGGGLWLAGLIALLCWRRRRTAVVDPAPALAPPLAERLRTLLDRARTGSLDAEGRARLERLVLGFWRERLDLTGLPLPEAVRRLRDHPEAGGLLRQVEEWLHSGKSAVHETEMAALLTPYLDSPAPAAGAAPTTP